MELVTGVMGSLLLKLGELVKEEYGLQKGVRKKIEKLSRELKAAHAVLRKIGEVPPDQLDELVRDWATDVREASYDMEDIIDTFLVRVDDPDEPTKPHMLRRLRKKVGSMFKKSKARRNISSLIDDINEKLEEVAVRRGRYTLDNIVTNPVPANTIVDPRIRNLYKRAADLVGIEGQRDKLIDMLSLENDVGVSGVHLSGNKKMKIVSIVGFGGLGKTTLAKAIYDHIKPRFECQAFVPVGRNPDIKKVFRDILMDLDEDTYTYYKLKGLDEKQLICKLNEYVKEKRYLIVIDDIWDKESWNFVKCALQESQCGSRLLITTRNSKVAEYDGKAYQIQPLSDADSKDLLYARIVDGEGKDLGSPSVEACENFLKKCGGVPLAIITIASLLASKPGEDWSEVYNSIGFGDKGNDDVYNTRKILSFSYYDMPSHLKACLLYLSIFPEDHVIEKNGLIWKWIAEGFITEEQATANGIGLFELGERYFNELINRNMIQTQETRYKGYVSACSVHDIVLDLIHQLSWQENFVTALNGGEGQKHQGSISRRLALQCVEEHNISRLANVAVEKVRSIFASDCDFCALCPSLPFLRVAEMEGCFAFKEDCMKDVSAHLGSLLHLRYLRLQSVTELPRKVRYLKFLQTLDLRENEIKELPEEVGLLTQLLCLRASWETRVPAGLVGKLTSLQELRICCRGEDATIIQIVKELGLLKELRVLNTFIYVRISESIKSALLESLGRLDNIQELEILGGSPSGCSDARWVSCRHLRLLRLDCFVFSELPAWIKSSLTLRLSYLEVTVEAVKDKDMETLANLPELSCLILRSYETKSMASIKICTDEGVGYFRRLRFLMILGQPIWFDLRGSECNSSSLASSNTIMPSLESLEFCVRVRSLKDENSKLQLGFYKMLSFQNLGTNSLQRVVITNVLCDGASTGEVEEAEAALRHAARVHPKHPTLDVRRKEAPAVVTSIELATGAMSGLLPKLGKLLKEEYGLQKGVKKNIEFLTQELEVLHVVLRKMGDMPDQLDELVRLWARDVRETSYDIEDMVDKFLVCVNAPEPATQLHMLHCLMEKVSKARRNTSALIQEMNMKLEEVAARHDRYTFDNIVPKPEIANTMDPGIFNLRKRATELVGIEGPRRVLINMLSLEDDVNVLDIQAPDSKKMKIISIVGMGGLGKTTLAKAVYDHIKPRFEYHAFVPMPSNPDIKVVLRDILIALDEKTYTHPKLMGLGEYQLMCKLNEFVKDKRCFIVFDDIWDKQSWKLIRCALQQETNYQSRLLITTRVYDVASYASEVYRMQPFSEGNSKKLFYSRIADGEGKYFDNPSAEACDNFLKKCSGVPLPIITIASLLASKPKEDWSEVYNSIGFGRNVDLESIRKIFLFSCYDLPSHLKPCLLYLSIFPEDHVIAKNGLIWKWIAEGFITEEQAAAAGLGLFELGERYFNELINRNMIKPQETRYEGYVDACYVHDLVLDLIHLLSSEENFVTVWNGGWRQRLEGSISRRLAIHCVEEHNVGQLANVAVEKVRSLFSSWCAFHALCPCLPFLRVVEMVGCSVSEECRKDVSYHLGSLLHLRYLRLVSFSITKLSREVRYLRFLQTLDLWDFWIEELPEEVGLLTQLVCLRLRIYSKARVPAGLIGKLTSLQELCILWQLKGEDATMQFVKELGLLRELRVLQACIGVRISESIGSALLESLGHLQNIQELKICYSLFAQQNVSVSNAGCVSYRRLHFLHLECLLFSGLPVWINSSLAPNLSYLDVKVVAVKDQDMVILAKLPELSCLILHSRDTKSVVSIRITTDEGVGYFRKLRFFRVHGPSIWFDLHGSECNSSRVASSNTIMPSLEALEFDVHVRSLKDEKMQIGFDKMLGFQNVGTSWLHRVTAQVDCVDARTGEVEEAEAALKHAARVHPEHPTLLINKAESQDMLSRYQERRCNCLSHSCHNTSLES